MRALLLLILLLVLTGCSAAAQPAADITIGAEGCTTASYLLPKEREPLVTLANQSGVPMVFSIPTMDRWTVVAPGEATRFELPRYIMGSFDFFCLSEAEHSRLGGDNPFLCAFEPQELATIARSQGIFEIERHDRIQEVLGR